VRTWLAWRGSARAANPARPGEDFIAGDTLAAQGAPPGYASTGAASTPQPAQAHTASSAKVTGETPSSEATGSGRIRGEFGQRSHQRGGIL
jgi:hypothetical protein